MSSRAHLRLSWPASAITVLIIGNRSGPRGYIGSVQFLGTVRKIFDEKRSDWLPPESQQAFAGDHFEMALFVPATYIAAVNAYRQRTIRLW
jgi:hypothetical protein